MNSILDSTIFLEMNHLSSSHLCCYRNVSKLLMVFLYFIWKKWSCKIILLFWHMSRISIYFEDCCHYNTIFHLIPDRKNEPLSIIFEFFSSFCIVTENHSPFNEFTFFSFVVDPLTLSPICILHIAFTIVPGCLSNENSLMSTLWQMNCIHHNL